jgi:adenylate cyclase
VIARNSSFQYRGGNLDLKKVGAELGARYLVEGSVRRAGDQIRIATQLIDAPSGEHVWAETYDREVKDVFALQDEISATIAASIAGDVTRAEGERARQRGTANLDARDPLGYGALSFAYIMIGDVRNALDAARHAVELNPSMPEAWIWLSSAQLLSGDPDGCIASGSRAQQLNPQGPMASLAYENPAIAYWETGRYEGSLDAARRLIAARPTYFPGQVYLAMNAVALGHIDEARAAIAEARRLRPNLSLEMVQRNFGVSRPEIDARRNAALRQAGLE